MRKSFFKIIFVLLFLPSFGFGAILYFEPEKESLVKDDIFLVSLILDTEGEKINAAEVEIGFSQENLEIFDISLANSIFVFFPKEPQLEKEGKIYFVGGVPHGFEGKGKILTLAFKVISEQKQETEILILPSSQVFLNDGKGTKAFLKTKKAVFSLNEKKAFPQNEWEKILKEDKNPPEPFEIVLAKDPLIFEGKYFIAFYTKDNESGIDHYEVKEGKRPWKIAKSPYLLEDQTLKEPIFVKAVDKAKNERIAKLFPKKPPKKPIYQKKEFWGAILIILLLSFILMILKKRKK